VRLLEQARRLGVSERELLAAYPSLRAEDLVNAWNYARAHAAEIDAQIRENETLSGAILRELFGNVVEVTSLCGGREATQLHVLDETLSERCHIGPLSWNIGYGNNRYPVWRSPRAHRCTISPIARIFAALAAIYGKAV